MQDFAGLFSFLSSWFTGEHVKGKRVAAAKLVKSLAKQPTPGSRCGSPDLGFGEAGIGKPSDLKTPRRRGPGASSPVVHEGVLSQAEERERGSGSHSELVPVVRSLRQVGVLVTRVPF